MWKSLQRFRRLEPDSRMLWLRAAIALPAISYSLRFRGLRRTQSSLQKLGSRHSVAEPRNSERKLAAAMVTSRMVRSAAYHCRPDSTCLERAVALWWLLERQEIPCSLRIGTRKGADKFEAHAWVEFDGQAIDEDDSHLMYAPFDEAFSPTAL
jgi:hypothetical protein